VTKTLNKILKAEEHTNKKQQHTCETSQHFF